MATSLVELGTDARVARARGRRTVRLALPGMALTLVCLLPYLNKAYTIDDPLFLLSARQILKNPLQPMSYSVCWTGMETCVQSAAQMGPLGSQPLMGYLLVPAILSGGAEWTAHAMQILFGCMAVLAMVRLALRLGCDRVQSAAAGLLLAGIPPFLSTASSAMPDVLALALGLTGFERLLAWKDGRHWRDAALAGLALGFGPYARPHMVLLIALSALWLFNEYRVRKTLEELRGDSFRWAPILIATGILVGLNLLTRDRSPAESANLQLGHGTVLGNLYAYVLYLSFPIPFAVVWVATRWRTAPLLLVLPAVPVAILHFMLFPSKSIAQEWPTAAALYGLATLVFMFNEYVRMRDRTGLLLGLWLLIPVPACIYIHLPIKYMLVVLPAVILILIRTLSGLPRRRELSAYGVLALAGAAFSCVLLKADADFAEYGRRAAAELVAPHVAAGEKVWFGGQWGFYWYAQEAGARISQPGKPGPNAGELLAVGLMEGGNVTRDRFPARELVDSRHYKAPHGRTMGYGGGLYSNYFGDSVWVWSPETTNDYELWRIR